MALSLVLQVCTEPDGAWRISLGRVGAAPALGRLSPGTAAAALSTARSAASAEELPVLLVAEDDAAWTSGEERAGRALAGVLECAPAVTRVLAEAQGAADATGQPLVLLLDLPEPELRDLPWECLATEADGVPLESGGGGLVVRLGGGRSAAADGTLRPVLWLADPEDLAVDQLAEAVTEACQRGGLPAPVAADAVPEPDDAAVLFLVGHGEALDHHLRVLGEEGALAPGTVAHGLQPWLERAALVVLLVCEGGVRHPHAPDGLVDRLLHAGAAAVLASDVRLAVEAGRALVHGLCPALGHGDPLATAVAASRRAVRVLALPYPDARWWRLQLTVAEAAAVALSPRVQALPPGWEPDPAARALVGGAVGAAAALDHGWLGVEHLVAGEAWEALADRHLRHLLRRVSSTLSDLLRGWEPAPASPWQLSPRLVRVRAALGPGFGIDALAAAIVADLPPELRQRLGLLSSGGDDETLPGEGIGALLDAELAATVELDAHATREVGPASARGGPWSVLEVLGGPEDGRRLVVGPGELLGRHAPGSPAHHALYREVGATDPFLSRRHLRVDRDGAVVLQRPGHLLSSERETARPAGLVRLQAGDVLALTELTWVVATRGVQ